MMHIRPTHPLALCLLLLAALPAAGCGTKQIDETYGRMQGRQGGNSINGTAVLAGMFEQAGYQVSTWQRLSPKLDSYDVIVWAPDDFRPPTEEQREFLENWLWQGTPRTLVYIGRDYSAASTYWQKVQPDAPPEQAAQITRRLAQAKAEHDQARAKMPEEEYARWFTMRRNGPGRPAGRQQALQGEWAEGLDATQVEVELAGRLDVPQRADIPDDEPPNLPDFQVLLQSEGQPLVTRVTDRDWGPSQILVVANGSFLLNLPLVNHEHRKLAGKLIGQCGTPGRVVFLESGPGGPPVRDEDPDPGYPTVLKLFTIWPLNAIVLHLMALGIVYCFAVFPIFGRPRELEADSPSDFGKHVEALGELLERTGDQAYAHDRLQVYQQTVNPQSHTLIR